MRRGVPQPRRDRLPAAHQTQRQNILTPTGTHAIVARFLAYFIEQMYNLNGAELNQKEE